MFNSSIRVVSYNVLSSHLAEPDHFPKCKPEWLDAEYRFEKVKEKLLAEIKSPTPPILCLQEVSIPWADRLHVFFISQGYYMLTAQYGREFNGYMGVATAIPLSLYEVQAVHVDKPGDFIPKSMMAKNNPPPAPPVPPAVDGAAAPVADSAAAVEEAPAVPEKPCPWEISKFRANQMITVQLRQKASDSSSGSMDSGSFCISNYHMPCAFYNNHIMRIHSALSALLARKHATMAVDGTVRTLPFILTGDFNLKPSSFEYALLVNQDEADRAAALRAVDYSEQDPLEDEESFQPKFLSFCDSFLSKYVATGADDGTSGNYIDNQYRLLSVYRTVNGSEPNFTNYAVTAHANKEDPMAPPKLMTFVDTLDYMFYSQTGWRVHKEGLVAIPHRDDMAAVCDDPPACTTEATAPAAKLPKVDVNQSHSPLAAPLPNRCEPSDHLLIGCNFSLVA